ncbi:MAG TPA: hypothetical protein VKE74_15930, partial [Gemmataceae bacterium]|nr:hypothetical protein [Gemmataceae bacterium]
MPNATLSTQQLEEREVPAAAMFADIMPGIWGSYPLNLTPSGGLLYFSADNGHGYEPYITDGTPGSAHMLKDIKPGLGGSNPTNFIPADNGVVYFTASDGAQTTLWRSDGTRDGTIKVPGIPPGAAISSATAIGRNGVLHFAIPDPNTQTVQWWRTDGTTTTKLFTIGVAPPSRSTFEAIDGEVVLVIRYTPFDQVQALWRYDSTAGTVSPWQIRQIGNSPQTGSVELEVGVEISPGRFIHPSRDFSGTVTSLWVREGIGGPAPQLLKVLRGSGQFSFFADDPVRFQGKVYFAIQSDDPSVAGLWVTDGTAAGTKKSDLSVGDGMLERGSLSVLGGRLLIRTTVTSGHRFFFSNGTPAGTREAPRPEGATGPAFYVGTIPAGPDEPGGAVFVRSGSPTGPLYRTDGTAEGTVWVDPTGLPSGLNPATPLSYHIDGFGRAVPNWAESGVYFDGGLYFSAKNGDQRPEVWKWDASGPVVPPQVVAPTVEGVAVNDGAAQRSMVTKLTITFDRQVELSDGALDLRSASGASQLLFLTEAVIDGKTVVTVEFGSSLPGGSLSDGRYTLTV